MKSLHSRLGSVLQHREADLVPLHIVLSIFEVSIVTGKHTDGPVVELVHPVMFMDGPAPARFEFVAVLMLVIQDIVTQECITWPTTT